MAAASHDPRRALAEQKERQATLIDRFGMPGTVSPAHALAEARRALIPVDQTVTADDVYASVYRDDTAADAWLESNRANHGHPTLARVPLPDGRVIGILDLRPALQRAREERA